MSPHSFPCLNPVCLGSSYSLLCQHTRHPPHQAFIVPSTMEMETRVSVARVVRKWQPISAGLKASVAPSMLYSLYTQTYTVVQTCTLHSHHISLPLQDLSYTYVRHIGKHCSEPTHDPSEGYKIPVVSSTFPKKYLWFWRKCNHFILE